MKTKFFILIGSVFLMFNCLKSADFKEEDFMAGIFLKDAFGPNWGDNYGDGTLEALKNTGCRWIGIHYFWSYSSTSTPRIESPYESEGYSSHQEKVEDFKEMILKCINRDYKVFIVPSVNFGIMLNGINASAETDLNNGLYSVHTSTWYNNWFYYWKNFLLDVCEIAKDTGVELVATGFHVPYTAEDNRDGYDTTSKWKEMISELRAEYPDIKFTFLADTNGIESSDVSKFKFWDSLDYITLFMSGGVEHYAGTGTLTVTDIKKALFSMYDKIDIVNQSVLYNKKVIIIPSYSSSEYCFNGTWFEEFDPQPDVEKNLDAQKNFYDAFFQSLSTSTWIKGVFPWGYWWKDTDYNNYSGDDSFDKGPSIRGKPAEEVVYSYYSKLSEKKVISSTESVNIVLTPKTGNIKIKISSGTFSESVEINISTVSTSYLSDEYSSGKVNILPVGVDINLSTETALNKPVRITLSYTDDNLNFIKDESSLKLARYDTSEEKWIILESTAYSDSNLVKGKTTHMSVFGIVEPVEEVVTLDDIYAYKNPFNPSDGNLIVKNVKVNDIVEVYNINGELIKDIIPTFSDGSVIWDGKNAGGKDVSNGIYFILILREDNKRILKIALLE